MKLKLIPGLTISCLLTASSVYAGVVNPDCTPGKAAKGAAMKATVGVGGRCDFEETAKDPLEKQKKEQDGPLHQDKADKDKDGLLHHNKNDKD